MASSRISTLRGLALALASVALADATMFVLWPIVKPMKLPLFFGAVALTSWWGGQIPALIATLFSVLSITYFFQDPYYTLALDIGGGISVLLFVLISALLIHINDRLRVVEGQLEAANQLLNAVLEAVDEPVSILDQEWRLTYVNNACARYLHLDRDQLVGQVVWELFPTTLGTLFEDFYRRALRDQEPVRFEAFHRSSNHWLMVHAVPCNQGLIVSFMRIDGQHPMQNVLANCSQSDLRFRMEHPPAVGLHESVMLAEIYQQSRLEFCDGGLSQFVERASGQAAHIGLPLSEVFPTIDATNEQSILAFIRSGFRLDHANLCTIQGDKTRSCFTFQLVGKIEDGKLVSLTARRRPINLTPPGRATID